MEYPLNKFITEESVEKICNKYGLVYGTIDRYLGTVPTKNMKEIASFKIKEKDECYECEINNYGSRFLGIEQRTQTSYISRASFERKYVQKYGNGYIGDSMFEQDSGFSSTKTEKCKIEIAAPMKDFNMEGMELIGKKLKAIKVKPMEYDPVVLQPVNFENKKYYLIVTAWGLEASDELVVNQKFN